MYMQETKHKGVVITCDMILPKYMPTGNGEYHEADDSFFTCVGE